MQKSQFPLLQTLKSPSYLLFALGISFILFDISFYLILNLPGSINNACVDGANLNLTNLLFSFIIAILSGLIVSGFVKIFQNRLHKHSVKLASLSGIGFLTSSLTLFCSFCSLPIFSLFGFATIAQLFNTYNGVFKLVSIILLLFCAMLVNRQLKAT